MRVALVGGGYWGSKHLRVLQSISEVDEVLLAEPRVERQVALAKSFPHVRIVARLEDALEAEAVIIATPPRTHAGLALQALAAGRHVLVEKPMATSVRDATRMISAAAQSGSVLMVGHTFQFNAAVWMLRDLVRSGELGELFYIDSARLNLGLYQDDVNVLWDLAPHDISIFNYILDARPESVEAWGSAHANLLEDVASLRLTYDEPAVVATAHVSWLDPCKVRRVTVVGSKKMAVYNDLAVDERIRLYDKGVSHTTRIAAERGEADDALHAMPLSYRHGGITSPYVSFDEPLLTQDRHFVECALNGGSPQADGLDGLSVVQVLEAAEISLRERREIDLNARPHLLVPELARAEA